MTEYTLKDGIITYTDGYFIGKLIAEKNMYTLNELAKDIHENENKKWWFEEDGSPNLNSSKERRLLLMHSEISEAAERT